MKPSLRLRRDSADFLIRLQEQRSGRAVASLLDDLPDDCRRQLLETGFLVADGTEPTTIDASDEDLEFRHGIWRGSGYSFFSAEDGGIVDIDEGDASMLRVDQPTWLAFLADELNLSGAGRPTVLVPDHAWDIGDIWVSRTRKVPVLFARRIGVREVAAALREALHHRGARAAALVVTSSRHAETFQNCVVASLSETLTNSAAEFSIDRGVLLAAFGSSPAMTDPQSLYLSPKGTQLTINGEVRISFRGDIQIALIRALVQAHREGARYRAAELLAAAGSNATSLKRAFGTAKWKLLSPYLTSRGGLWGFDL